MSAPRPPYPKFPEQDENGVDLSIIRANLRRTPTERLRRAEFAIRGIESLRARLPEASRRVYEKLKAEW